jgi:hypothetical protein
MPEYGIPRVAYAAALDVELAEARNSGDKARVAAVRAEIERHAAEPDDAPADDAPEGGPAPLDEADAEPVAEVLPEADPVTPASV